MTFLVVLNVLQLLFLAYKFNYSMQIDRDVLRLEGKVESQTEMMLKELNRQMAELNNRQTKYEDEHRQ